MQHTDDEEDECDRGKYQMWRCAVLSISDVNNQTKRVQTESWRKAGAAAAAAAAGLASQFTLWNPPTSTFFICPQ